MAGSWLCTWQADTSDWSMPACHSSPPPTPPPDTAPERGRSLMLLSPRFTSLWDTSLNSTALTHSHFDLGKILVVLMGFSVIKWQYVVLIVRQYYLPQKRSLVLHLPLLPIVLSNISVLLPYFPLTWNHSSGYWGGKSSFGSPLLKVRFVTPDNMVQRNKWKDYDHKL